MAAVSYIPEIDPDRVLGGLVGHLIGESLGHPYEFGSLRKEILSKMPYTGKVEYPFYIMSRWKMNPKPGAELINPHLLAWPAGTIGDDTEMTRCALLGLIGETEYNPDKTLKLYIEWASSTPINMGKNIQKLMGHPKIKDRLAKYRKVYSKSFPHVIDRENCVLPPATGQILSNGALMRCFPLAVLPTLQAFSIDCMLTNPYPISVECNTIYGLACWMAIRGWPRDLIYTECTNRAILPEIKMVFHQLENGSRDITGKTKSWCVHGLYCAMKVLKDNMTYKQTVDAFSHIPNSDTDTNAAIAGSLAGALEGYKAMMKEETTKDNYEIIKRQSNINYEELISQLIL